MHFALDSVIAVLDSMASTNTHSNASTNPTASTATVLVRFGARCRPITLNVPAGVQQLATRIRNVLLNVDQQFFFASQR